MSIYKVSVITAVGKLEHYELFIERYFSNIRNQTMFNDIEIVIVYTEWHSLFDEMKKYENFKFIHDTESNGMYNAWNIGIKNSTSNYITNWNIDDLRFPTNIEKKYEILNENSDISLVYNWYVVSSNINETYENFDYREPRLVDTYPDNAHEFVYQCCMCGPDPMWRRNIHDSIGYFDINFPAIADWEMWVRMASIGLKFKLIPEVLCIFYENKDSISNRLSESREMIEKPNLYKKYDGFKSPKISYWQKSFLNSEIKLSILILTLNSRKYYLDRILNILNNQKTEEVEILINSDNGEKSIGQKRNELLDKSIGKYISFIDDDDIVENCYVQEILNAIKSNPDCVGIHLLHKEDGILKGLTYHSLKYKNWFDEENKENSNLRNYYRNPNHLNPIKREYSLKVKFPNINNGEDRYYSMNILKYLETEVYIEKPIYQYLVRTNKEC